MPSKEIIFREIKELLKKNSKGLKVVEGLINSSAKNKKPGYHLYGKKIASIIPGRKPQPTYIVGIIEQKNFVGFYSMPVYSHRKEFAIKNQEIKKSLKGKSCFNIKKLDSSMLKEIDSIIKKGIKIYKKEGWI